MNNTPVIGVLALQGDVREHVAALEAGGARTRTVRRPAELDEVDGLVLPGGESTTIDKLLRAFGLHDPLRQRISDGMPVYGSCAGMILLADRLVEAHSGQQTLGAIDILVRRNAFGRQVDSFEEDLDIDLGADEEGPMRAIFIRAPWVEEVGADVQVLAAVQIGDRTHPVAVRQGNALATSFHPEVTGDLRVHRYFTEMVRLAGR